MNSLRRTACFIATWAVLGLGLVLTAAQAPPSETQPAGVRFEWLDFYIDSGDAPLAAWQFELSGDVDTFQIVGIEGGDHVAFAQPPYYDPAALRNHRVILAAFSTDESLPTGRTRVARVHVMIEGDQPKYLVDLTVAATADGSEIPVEILTEEGAQP
jgi:hypothetical protein